MLNKQALINYIQLLLGETVFCCFATEKYRGYESKFHLLETFLTSHQKKPVKHSDYLSSTFKTLMCNLSAITEFKLFLRRLKLANSHQLIGSDSLELNLKRWYNMFKDTGSVLVLSWTRLSWLLQGFEPTAFQTKSGFPLSAGILRFHVMSL